MCIKCDRHREKYAKRKKILLSKWAWNDLSYNSLMIASAWMFKVNWDFRDKKEISNSRIEVSPHALQFAS